MTEDCVDRMNEWLRLYRDLKVAERLRTPAILPPALLNLFTAESVRISQARAAYDRARRAAECRPGGPESG